LCASDVASPTVGCLGSATAASPTTIVVAVAASTTSEFTAAAVAVPSASTSVAVAAVATWFWFLARFDYKTVFVLDRSAVVATASTTIVVVSSVASATVVVTSSSLTIVIVSSSTAASVSTTTLIATVLVGWSIASFATYRKLHVLGLFCSGIATCSILSLRLLGVISSSSGSSLLLGCLGGLGRLSFLSWSGRLRTIVVVEDIEGVQFVTKRSSDLLILVSLLGCGNLCGFSFSCLSL